MVPFIAKYVPASLDEIEGHVVAKQTIVDGLQDPKRKCVLLYGPPGTGKTSLVHALAKEYGFELVEVNASDYRTADMISSTLGGALLQQSLFGGGKLIFIDELDGLSGRKDRGGLKTMVALLKKTTFPVFVAAQQPWDSKFSSLRKLCDMISMDALSYKDIAAVLQRICDTENILYDLSILQSLARRSGGDCRAAINDLQALASVNALQEKEGLDDVSEREQIISMPQALVKILKTTDPSIALSAFEDVQEDVDQQFLWVDENMPEEYTLVEDRARAYVALSKADVFRRRIRRWQHWRFLVYVNALLTGSVAVSKKEKYRHMVSYKPTGRLLKLWWANQKSLKKKSIAGKIAHASHTSLRRILPSIDYYKVMVKEQQGFGDCLMGNIDLDREELAWLKK